MKNITVLACALACLTSVAAVATPAKPHKAVAATMYECQVCHMKVSAAVAKKDHYHDPMDGGALIPVKPAVAKSSSMGGMKM